MVLSKYKLPNGNVFIWLGKGGIWEKSEGVDNVLILNGGDVLFLKTMKVLPLYEEKVKQDLKNLGHEEFVKKYELPADGDLLEDLKKGVITGEYPPFLTQLKKSQSEEPKREKLDNSQQ